MLNSMELYHRLVDRGLISKDGKVNHDQIDYAHLNLNLEPSEKEAISYLLQKSDEVLARTSLTLCKMSAKKVIEVSRDSFFSLGYSMKAFLRGSTMRRLLFKTFCRVFHSLTQQKVELFVEKRFKKYSLDTDFFIYCSECRDPMKWHLILENGLIKHLTEELKNQKLRRGKLATEFEKGQRLGLASHKESYAYKTALKIGKIRSKDVQLEKKYIEMVGFKRAVDGNTITKHQYFERVIGRMDRADDDFTFSNLLPDPTRPLDAIYVDLLPILNEKGSRSVRLNSFLGQQELVQAVFDAVLHNITFDPKKAATPTDFVRTLSFFLTGGKCFQPGWIDKIWKALTLEAMNQGITWPEFLAKQLISHTYNHYGKEHGILISLTFNASSLLLWKQVATHEELRNLWNLIFTEVEKNHLEEDELTENSNFLLEGIKMALRGWDCKFEDIYAQLQVSATLNLNQKGSAEIPYFCQQFLTEHHIFIGIQHRLKQENYFLIFPYDLPDAIKHLRYLYVNKTYPGLLQHLHALIFNDSSAVFGLMKSPKKAFRCDARLNKKLVITNIEQLLREKNDISWMMGLHLALSQLAQEEDPFLLYNLLKSFVFMLRGNWVSDTYKHTVIQKIKSFFDHSSISFKPSLFERILERSSEGIYLSESLLRVLSVECLHQGQPAFMKLASEFLGELAAVSDPKALFESYRYILGNYLLKKNYFNFSFIWLIEHLHKHLSLSYASKFLLLLYIYQNPQAIPSEVQKKLFISFLDVWGQLKDIPVMTGEFKSELQGITLKILKTLPTDDSQDEKYRFLAILTKFGLLDSNEMPSSAPLCVETITHESLQVTLEDWKNGEVDRKSINPFLKKFQRLPFHDESKDLLSKTLERLSHLTLKQEALDNILLVLKQCQFHLWNDPEKLADFWLSQLSNISSYHLETSATSIRILILEQFLLLITQVNPSIFENAIYENLVTYLSEKEIHKNLPAHVISQATEPLLKELYTRKLWFPLLHLAKLMTIPQWSYLLEAGLQVYKSTNLSFLFSILAPLTEKDISPSQLSSDYFPLYKALAEFSLEKKDYVQLFKWLTLLPPPLESETDFWDFIFFAARNAIKEKATGLAIPYLQKLPVLDPYTFNWVRIYEPLLRLNEIKAVLSLVHANQSKTIAVMGKCESLLEQLFSCTITLLPFETTFSKQQINDLLRLIYTLLSESDLNTPERWKTYISITLKGATGDFFAEIFTHFFIEQKASLYFPDQQQRLTYCWMPFLNAMAHHESISSKILVTTEGWMPYLLSEITDNTVLEDVIQLSHDLAKASLRALKENPNSKSASHILNFLTNEKIYTQKILFSNGSDHALKIAEIILMTKTQSGLLEAASCLILIFLFMETSPLCEEHSVHLANQIVKNAMQTTDNILAKRIEFMILLASVSDYCRYGDLFQYLKFLLKHQSKFVSKELAEKEGDVFQDLEFLLKHQSNFVSKKLVEKSRELVEKSRKKHPTSRLVSGVYLDIICRILELLFSNPAEQNPNLITKKHIELVSQSIFQLYRYNNYKYASFISWCSDQEMFSFYVDSNQRDLVMLAKKLQKKDPLNTFFQRAMGRMRLLYLLYKLKIIMTRDINSISFNFFRRSDCELDIIHSLTKDFCRFSKIICVIALIAATYVCILRFLVNHDKN